jgi:glycosyltransferase involved in cell wall biosynthesis
MAEAMACGVPPVVTPGVNLSPEIAARRAGWLAEPTAADLAETLASAIADRDDRAARGQAARAMAVDFRWPAAAAALIELYDRLAAARPVRA